MFRKILAAATLLCATLALAAVDVNKATEAELDSVKGIGPGTSRTILQERRKGDFKDWNDFVSRVKGVGTARAANLSEAGLTVGGKGYRPVAAASRDGKASKGGQAARAGAKPGGAATAPSAAASGAKK